jgi:uncharacterized protein (DUF924 family)
MTGCNDIIEYWFGSATENLQVMAEQSSLWWKKDPEIDTHIKDQFELYLFKLINGELDGWRGEPHGYLAMMILADQFSRNMYRDTANSFATDVLAVSLSLEGIENKKDIDLRLVERIFFYMPLMHAESLDMQDKALRLFEKIVDLASDEEKKSFQANLDYSKQHRDIIFRFKRFPHRNRILDRQSTEEEIEFLKQPGSSF